MAKIAPKGKKVTGTKKKDKITWVSQKPWKKALTVNAGKGNDVINFKKSKYKNTLNGQAGNDIIYGGKSIDKINGGAGNDKLYGYNGNDVIKGGAGNDYIDGGAGNDVIYGDSGSNTITGGAGNDVIYSGSGSDRIIYSKNSGKDVVYNSTNKDTIVLRNIDFSEGYDLGRSGNDLVIYQGKNNYNGSVTLKNYFTQSASTRLKNIYFEKNKQTVTIPTDLSSLKNKIVAKGNIKGSSFNDDIVVTGGGSTVHSSAGNDNVDFRKTGQNLFTDDSAANTVFYTTLNGLTGTDTISVNNIEDIFMYDELELGLDDYGNKILCIPDYLDREGLLDVNVKLTSTNYTAPLRTFLSNMGYEVVSGNATIDHWVQKVIAEGGAATITGADHGAGATIRTGNKNDVVNISTGRNEVYTNGGDDIIYVTGGVNNWIAAGQGRDTISISCGKNNITLAGENVVNITGGYNTVYCEDIDETINAIGGMNEIYGAGGDDYIIGNPNGGTTFYIYENDGNDTISTGHGAGIKADVIKFCDNSLDQLFFSFDGVDGMLQYDNYVIRIKDFLTSEDITDINGVNIWVEDTNGKRCRLTDLYTYEPNSTQGTYYSDSISGTDYSDTLYGGLGNDTICHDSSGNDSMYGGEGANLYKFLYASGIHDAKVFSTSGKDTIYVYNPTKNDFVKDGSDLVIQTSVENQPGYHEDINIYIKDWFNNPVDITYDNSYTTVSILDKVNQMGLSGVACGTTDNDTISGASGLIIAGAGNDSITAANTGSTIFGGLGNDTLRGGSGNDYIYASYASKIADVKYGSFNDNKLYGGDGNDWLYAYGENAYMYGGNGNDHYSVMLSSNTYIEDSNGSNILHIEKSDITFIDERAYIVLNVRANGQLADATNSFFVLNKSSYDYWLTCGSFGNFNDKFGGVTVCCVDTNLNPSAHTQTLNQIMDSSDRYTDQGRIYTLAQDVASWLSGTDYESVSDVIQTGTAEDKAALITYFNNFNDTQWIQAMG